MGIINNKTTFTNGKTSSYQIELVSYTTIGCTYYNSVLQQYYRDAFNTVNFTNETHWFYEAKFSKSCFINKQTRHRWMEPVTE